MGGSSFSDAQEDLVMGFRVWVLGLSCRVWGFRVWGGLFEQLSAL